MVTWPEHQRGCRLISPAFFVEYQPSVVKRCPVIQNEIMSENKVSRRKKSDKNRGKRGSNTIATCDRGKL